jgi:hypothetical protein
MPRYWAKFGGCGVGFDSEAANLHESMEQLLRCESEFFAAEGRM